MRHGARDDGVVNETTDVTVDDTGIRLGQLLKYAGVTDSGADAKALLAGGDVRVNGEPEDRRGRQLFAGDVVDVDGPGGQARVVLRAAVV